MKRTKKVITAKTCVSLVTHDGFFLISQHISSRTNLSILAERLTGACRLPATHKVVVATHAMIAL